MTCPNCNNQLSSTNLPSCPFCNTPLNFNQQPTMDYGQQQPMMDYGQQPMPTYVAQPPQQVIRPKKSSNVGSIILKIIGGLFTLAILAALFLFFTTKHLYCSKSGEYVMVFYTDKKLVWCLNLFGSENQCAGFNDIKDLANESNIKDIIVSIQDEETSRGYTCKIN